MHRPLATGILGRCMSLGVTNGFRMEDAAVGEIEDRKAVLESILAFCSGLDGVLLSGIVRPSDIVRVHQLEVPCVVLGQIASDPLAPNDPSWRFGHIVSGDDIVMGRHATTRLTSALPAWWIIQHRPRDRSGLNCPTCGYDLRASKDKCPECGAAIRAKIKN